MFFGDKKGLAAAIVERSKPMEEAVEEKSEMSSAKEELTMCAQEIMDAIHSKDVGALAEALSAFDEINDAMEESHESESEEEPGLGEKVVG